MNPRPTAPIRLLMRDGPQRGQDIAFGQQSIRFGRATDNDVVLSLDAVSRYHGRISLVDGKWTLTVEGRNSACVNGRDVGSRVRSLKDHDTISVGDHPLFQILIHHADTEMSAGEETPAGYTPRLSRRGALWTGIGIYLLCMTALILFLFSLRLDNEGRRNTLEPLTATEIKRIIRRPLPPEKPYPTGMDEALTLARSIAERLEARPDKLFEAYTAYRKAIACSPDGRLTEGRDILAFTSLRDQLSVTVYSMYVNAYQHFMSHQYEAADAAFTDLLAFYPDAISPVHQSVVGFLAETRRQREASRKKRRRSLF